MFKKIKLNINLKILGVLIILLINKNNAENLTTKFDIIKSLNNEKTNELNKILIEINNNNNLFDSKNYINKTEKIAFILLPKPINLLLSMSSSIILKYNNNNNSNIDTRKILKTEKTASYEKSIMKIGNETSCYLENLIKKITNEIDKLINHKKPSTIDINNETKNQNIELKIAYELRKTMIYFNNFYDDNINCLLTNECISYEREKLFDILINRSSKFRISLLTFVTQYINSLQSSNEKHGFFNYVLHELQKRAKERRDCNIEIEQSEIYRLYVSLMLTLEKCYSLVIAAYMIRYRENQSNQTIAMGYFSSAIKSLKKLNEDTIFITKNAENVMKQLSTEIRRCDPPKHVKGVTYDRFLYAYGTYTGFTWDRFYNDQHHNYTYVDRLINPSNYSDGIYGTTNQGWIRLKNNCLNDNNIAEIRHYYKKNCTDKLYHHFEITYKNNTRETFGKSNSKNNQSFVMKYFQNRLKFGNNFCGRYCRSPVEICSIKDFNKTIRHISLMSVDATPNFVVTGIRWKIKKKILYFEIQEGKYVNDNVINSTIHWKKTPTHEIENKTITIGDNFVKGFMLDNIFLPSGYYLTGIQFVQNNTDEKNDNLVKIKIKGQQFNKNINDTVYRTMNSILKNSLQLQMDKPDASEFSLNNMILSKPGDYIYFKSSDMKKDAGQSTVPYLDIQNIETSPARPLSGIGSYYKGSDGYGGFVALRAFISNMTSMVNPMNIEIYTTIIENVIEKLHDEKL